MTHPKVSNYQGYDPDISRDRWSEISGTSRVIGCICGPILVNAADAAQYLFEEPFLSSFPPCFIFHIPPLFDHAQNCRLGRSGRGEARPDLPSGGLRRLPFTPQRMLAFSRVEQPGRERFEVGIVRARRGRRGQLGENCIGCGYLNGDRHVFTGECIRERGSRFVDVTLTNFEEVVKNTVGQDLPLVQSAVE